MLSLLWVPITIVGAALQVARNALQRGMMSSAGPWGATLVRFLFALPFSILFILVTLVISPGAQPHFTVGFWISAAIGATAQILATTTLLLAMERAGFAVATALQQSSLPIAAIVGLIVYGDRLSNIAWIGVALATTGLVILTWPAQGATGPKPVSGSIFGLLSGLCFGFSLNAFRHASVSFDTAHPLFAAVATVAIVQAMQSGVLTTYLLLHDRDSLRSVMKSWRQSLGAGICGSVSSACWFIALGMSPAAPVRAVGVVAAPIAALTGRGLFQEHLTLKQILAGLTVVGGVVFTALF